MLDNAMWRLARETRKQIRTVFGEKADTIVAYDVMETPEQRGFKLNFVSHDYFGVQFNYENDLCEFLIVLNDQFNISLSKPTLVYSEVQDWDAYLRKIMAEIELRIPDKFLKAKGWL